MMDIWTLWNHDTTPPTWTLDSRNNRGMGTKIIRCQTLTLLPYVNKEQYVSEIYDRKISWILLQRTRVLNQMKNYCRFNVLPSTVVNWPIEYRNQTHLMIPPQ